MEIARAQQEMIEYFSSLMETTGAMEEVGTLPWIVKIARAKREMIEYFSSLMDTTCPLEEVDQLRCIVKIARAKPEMVGIEYNVVTSNVVELRVSPQL